jgi:hypothetical protein
MLLGCWRGRLCTLMISDKKDNSGRSYRTVYAQSPHRVTQMCCIFDTTALMGYKAQCADLRPPGNRAGFRVSEARRPPHTLPGAVLAVLG